MPLCWRPKIAVTRPKTRLHGKLMKLPWEERPTP
jgi:hypothetical protein